MSGSFDPFGNDRYQQRVPYDAAVAPLAESDLANLKSAAAELGGFAGKEISQGLETLGVDPGRLRTLLENIDGPVALAKAPRETLLGLFLLSGLVCAALGDEELATITGAGRDEHFLTARRLYHALTNPAG